jgi:hypothetical protein
MTLAELLTELRSNLGNVSTDAISDDRLTLWLNNCQIELLSAFQFFQNEKKVTTTMVVDQAEYQLPSDCLAIYDLRDNTVKRKIRRTHYRKIDNVDYTISGDPTHYIRFGNYIQLIPVPDSANTMMLRYCVTPIAMSGSSDTPTVPVPWHEALLLGAEVRGWRALGEYKRAAIAKNEYISLVRSRAAEWEIEDSDEEFGIEMTFR